MLGNAIQIFEEQCRLGIGTVAPDAQYTFAPPTRCSESTVSNTASFMLVRTDPIGSVIWKDYVVGTDAAGPNNGAFVINDLGQAAGGPGVTRMRINNDGSRVRGYDLRDGLLFGSSKRFKRDVTDLSDSLAKTMQLQGVSFVWKDSGKPSLGLIAEDVVKVFPELVKLDEKTGKPAAVNYQGLIAVLVEALKEQQKELNALKRREAELRPLERKEAMLKHSLNSIEKRMQVAYRQSLALGSPKQLGRRVLRQVAKVNAFCAAFGEFVRSISRSSRW